MQAIDGSHACHDCTGWRCALPVGGKGALHSPAGPTACMCRLGPAPPLCPQCCPVPAPCAGSAAACPAAPSAGTRGTTPAAWAPPAAAAGPCGAASTRSAPERLISPCRPPRRVSAGSPDGGPDHLPDAAPGANFLQLHAHLDLRIDRLQQPVGLSACATCFGCPHLPLPLTADGTNPFHLTLTGILSAPLAPSWALVHNCRPCATVWLLP